MSIFSRIVFVGGGIFSLVAALMLGKGEGEIVIIEGDPKEQGISFRRGVPQGNHIHQLSAAALIDLEKLIPNLSEMLDKLGVPKVIWGTKDTQILFQDGEMLSQDKPIGIVTRNMTRPLLEYILRAAVLEQGNVTFIGRHRVIDLTRDASGSRVTGVSYIKMPGNSSQPIETISADYVVVGTGNDGWVNWLLNIKYPEPNKRVLNAGLTYMTADFKGVTLTSRMIGAADTLDNPRGGVIMEHEYGLIKATGYEYHMKGKVPETQEEYLLFLQSVDPRLSDQLKGASLVGKVHKVRPCVSRVWELENALWPEGLLIGGSAHAQFNPKYGQGMKVAIDQAKIVTGAIQNELPSYEFRQKLMKSVKIPWLLAYMADVRQMRQFDPASVPAASWGERAMQFYTDSLDKSDSQTRDMVLATFLRIAQLETSFATLFHPKIVAAFVKTLF